MRRSPGCEAAGGGWWRHDDDAGRPAGYSLIRHSTNRETVLTAEGTSEIRQLVIGKALTGLDAFGG